MTITPFRHVLAVGFFLLMCGLSVAEPEVGPAPRVSIDLLSPPRVVPPPKPLPPVPGYLGVDKAVAAKVVGTAGRTETGYLGISVMRDDKGLPLVEEVQPDSPAAKAGIKKGDILTRVGEQPVRTPQAFREWLQTRLPGESVKIGLLRDGKPLDVETKLIATSRPLKVSPDRAYFGAEFAEETGGEGVRVQQVVPRSPAETAGLKVGDRILRIDGFDVARASRLTDSIAEKKVGETVALAVRRDDKDLDIRITLAARGGRFGGGGGGTLTLWKPDVFRLAVVGIEFSDTKHNAKIAPAELNKLVFSTATFTDKSATGHSVAGSLNDWFREQSAWNFRLEGKVFDWVEVAKKRGDYIQGTGTSNKTAVLTDALDKLVARDGKASLSGFDGIFFVYAGESYRTNAGAVYYPHAGVIDHSSKRSRYFIAPEGGSRLTAISSFAKPACLMLGLPDLAARSENLGSEGLGKWCVLSTPTDTGRPQHLSAWAKVKVGWVKPTVIDPAIRQKLVLAPIEDAPTECFKVLVRPDGSEYFLLENRKKKGFDADLPGEGLLIWRIVNDRPILEESHGIEGPSGPTAHLSAVPFPSVANNAFTPDTTPSSRSPLGGGLPVHITEIKRLADGRITFHVGYEYR